MLGGKSLGVKQEEGEEVVLESMMVPPVFPRFWREGKLMYFEQRKNGGNKKTTFFRAGQSRGTRTHPV